MTSFFKNEFDIYRKMLHRESQKSGAGLSVLNKFVQKVCDSVSNTNDQHDIQHNIRLLSICCQILESFNAKIEILMSSLDEGIFNEVMQSTPNAVCLRIKDWMGDLSSYQIGDTFKGYVSYLLQGDKKLCFIKDLSRPTSVDFRDYVESAFKGVPPYGYIFAAELNQKYLRAIRIDSEASNMSFRVRLIDIGETVSLSPNMALYDLCDEAKRLPPLAILCYIEKVNGKVLNSLETVYKKTLDVHVNNICVNLLEVDLSSDCDIANEIQNQSLEKSIIECAEIANQMPIENDHMPLEDNQVSLEDDEVLLQDDQVPSQNSSVQSTPEKNVQPVRAISTTNPFLTALDDLEASYEEESQALQNIPLPMTGGSTSTPATPLNQAVSPPPLPQSMPSTLPSLPKQIALPPKVTTSSSPLPTWPNQTISPQKSISPQKTTSSPTSLPPQLPLPPLPVAPPLPPRQGSFRATDSNSPIRIPTHIVHRPNKQESANKTADAINNNTRPITPNVMHGTKLVPEIHETPNRNGNGYFIGEHNLIENDMNNHELPCPCKSGAHPKQETKCQENGYGHRPTLVRNLSSLPSPSKGHVVSVIPSHIDDLNRIYVQFCEHSKKFDDVQYNMLQNIQPKPFRYIPKVNDYVLARYTDGFLYRGRIEAIDEKTAAVFYVDYGNTEYVTHDVLFEWDVMCNVLPFQAVQCKLANAHGVSADATSKAVDFIINNYLNKQCKILVLDHLDNGLVVKMKTEHDRDIVDEIIENLFPGCMV